MQNLSLGTECHVASDQGLPRLHININRWLNVPVPSIGQIWVVEVLSIRVDMVTFDKPM